MFPRDLTLSTVYNELCREHRNHKKTLYIHDHRENLCIAVLSLIPLCKTFYFFFNEGYFYSRSLQKYSRTSVENSRTFQGYPTIFQFLRIFQGPCEPRDSVLKLLSSWTLHNLLLALRKGGFQCTVVNLYCRFKDQTQVHGLPSGFFIFLVANHISFTEIRN